MILPLNEQLYLACGVASLIQGKLSTNETKPRLISHNCTDYLLLHKLCQVSSRGFQISLQNSLHITFLSVYCGTRAPTWKSILIPITLVSATFWSRWFFARVVSWAKERYDSSTLLFEFSHHYGFQDEGQYSPWPKWSPLLRIRDTCSSLPSSPVLRNSACKHVLVEHARTDEDGIQLCYEQFLLSWSSRNFKTSRQQNLILSFQEQDNPSNTSAQILQEPPNNNIESISKTS